MVQFAVIMYIKIANLPGSKIIVCFILLLFLNQRVCAEDEVEELRKDILELEKIVNPFIRIFQKVSILVAPSVVSIVGKALTALLPTPTKKYLHLFPIPGKRVKNPRILIDQVLAPES